ncbi:GTPase HflX, partial [Myxococcota bacterium]|nr:GTPase HflX [Myxococcota bacterium]MBU1537059.1 GTPase HflX [Myxococcota bacterium]
MEVKGNLDGLKPSQLKSLENLYRRRVVPRDVISPSLGTTLVSLSREIGREVALFIDRKGQIFEVFVGSAQYLSFPEMDWSERGRLAGLRLVHAHPDDMGLREDDLTNLVINRLDMVVVLFRAENSASVFIEYATTTPAWEPQRVESVPLHTFNLDFLSTIRELELQFTAEEKVRRVYGKNQAILCIVGESRKKVDRRLTELQELARTAMVHVDAVQFQIRKQPDPRTLVGKGKLDEIILAAKKFDSDMIIFDPELSPTQAKSITQLTELKVLDRTMLILDIFAQRASTSEGKLQVELAQLKYSLPRLVGKNAMMSRLMGGIGGRGPGETKLEIDRRRAQSRIEHLEKQITQLSSQRSLRRQRRKDRRIPVISILGYTNAGKSTLLRTITGADVLIEDKLFATLDPRTRRVRFPRNMDIIFTDTVGFIEDLPQDLQKAFRATLEELAESDLIVHLVDISDDDHDHKQKAVENIMTEMGLNGISHLTVYNKVDRLSYLD